MVARVVGVLVALLVVGAAAGYGVAALTEGEPAAIGTIAPVPAQSPSVPAGSVEVLSDPATAALAGGLPTHLERVGSPTFGVRLPVPDGWRRYDTGEAESNWRDPAQPLSSTYLLRAKLIGSQHLTIPQATTARLAALRAAVDDLQVEQQDDQSFVVTYVTVAPDSHRRLALERFLSLDGTSNAQVTVAVVGRLADRAGLEALITQVTAGTTRPPRPS